MSMNDVENKYMYVVPKAPKPKINIVPRKISNINLIEVDDDSDSDSESNQIHKNISNYCRKLEKCEDNDYLSDDRYEDSFDENFGQCETNPDSGNIKKT